MTPLQMAEVAAAVANGGKLMKPQIWEPGDRPRRPRRRELDPSECSQPISAETGDRADTAMEGVVSEGTGTNAAISGVPVAGKTGTAETPGNEACGGGTTRTRPGSSASPRPTTRRSRSRRRSSARTGLRQRHRGADLPRRRGSDPEWRMS